MRARARDATDRRAGWRPSTQPPGQPPSRPAAQPPSKPFSKPPTQPETDREPGSRPATEREKQRAHHRSPCRGTSRCGSPAPRCPRPGGSYSLYLSVLLSVSFCLSLPLAVGLRLCPSLPALSVPLFLLSVVAFLAPGLTRRDQTTLLLLLGQSVSSPETF
eukprot:COSAG03_NODE_8603_length_788_cov_1.108853_2_plen_161_part_00